MSSPSSSDPDSFLASYFDELLADPVDADADVSSVEATKLEKGDSDPDKHGGSIVKDELKPTGNGTEQLKRLENSQNNESKESNESLEKKTVENAPLARTGQAAEPAPSISTVVQGASVAQVPSAKIPHPHIPTTPQSSAISTHLPDAKPELQPELQPVQERVEALVQKQAYLEEKQKQKLQALLDQGIQLHAPTKTTAAPKTVTQVQQKIQTSAKVEVEPKAKTHVDVETKIETSTQAAAEIDVAASTASTVQTGYSLGVNDILEWHENGRPMWAQERFDVLLFEVSGLTLAVPLVALGQIQPLDDSLTPLFGQSDWFMGLLNSTHGKIKTINTALFVMPEKYSDKFLDSAKYVISIDGLSWGLAVDKVNQPVSLDPSEVKWRGERTKRPWLAGTVKSAMCALIDIPQMAKQLVDSDKNAVKR